MLSVNGLMLDLAAFGSVLKSLLDIIHSNLELEDDGGFSLRKTLMSFHVHGPGAYSG